MKSITIGKSGTRTMGLDLDVLLRTRLLVQANSGGGKSWLLRRLAAAPELLATLKAVLPLIPNDERCADRRNASLAAIAKAEEKATVS